MENSGDRVFWWSCFFWRKTPELTSILFAFCPSVFLVKNCPRPYLEKMIQFDFRICFNWVAQPPSRIQIYTHQIPAAACGTCRPSEIPRCSVQYRRSMALSASEQTTFGKELWGELDHWATTLSPRKPVVRRVPNNSTYFRVNLPVAQISDLIRPFLGVIT